MFDICVLVDGLVQSQLIAPCFEATFGRRN